MKSFRLQKCGDAEYIAAFTQIVLPIAYEVRYIWSDRKNIKHYLKLQLAIFVILYQSMCYPYIEKECF